MKALTKEQAAIIRTAVYEYSHSLTSASAYRVRSLRAANEEERKVYSESAAYWQEVATSDKKRLAALGIDLDF